MKTKPQVREIEKW